MKLPVGLQSITKPGGFCIPFNIKSSLPYMTLRPYTDVEWDTLPHVILTGDNGWDPNILDKTIDDDNTWFDLLPDYPYESVLSLLELHVNYKQRYAIHCACINDS